MFRVKRDSVTPVLWRFKSRDQLFTLRSTLLQMRRREKPRRYFHYDVVMCVMRDKHVLNTSQHHTRFLCGEHPRIGVVFGHNAFAESTIDGSHNVHAKADS